MASGQLPVCQLLAYDMLMIRATNPVLKHTAWSDKHAALAQQGELTSFGGLSSIGAGMAGGMGNIGALSGGGMAGGLAGGLAGGMAGGMGGGGASSGSVGSAPSGLSLAQLQGLAAGGGGVASKGVNPPAREATASCLCPTHSAVIGRCT